MATIIPNIYYSLNDASYIIALLHINNDKIQRVMSFCPSWCCFFIGKGSDALLIFIGLYALNLKPL